MTQENSTFWFHRTRYRSNRITGELNLTLLSNLWSETYFHAGILKAFVMKYGGMIFDHSVKTMWFIFVACSSVLGMLFSNFEIKFSANCWCNFVVKGWQRICSLPGGSNGEFQSPNLECGKSRTRTVWIVLLFSQSSAYPKSGTTPQKLAPLNWFFGQRYEYV